MGDGHQPRAGQARESRSEDAVTLFPEDLEPVPALDAQLLGTRPRELPLHPGNLCRHRMAEGLWGSSVRDWDAGGGVCHPAPPLAISCPRRTGRSGLGRGLQGMGLGLDGPSRPGSHVRALHTAFDLSPDLRGSGSKKVQPLGSSTSHQLPSGEPDL